MATSRGPEQRGARSAGPVRCSGAVLLGLSEVGGMVCVQHTEAFELARRVCGWRSAA